MRDAWRLAGGMLLVASAAPLLPAATAFTCDYPCDPTEYYPWLVQQKAENVLRLACDHADGACDGEIRQPELPEPCDVAHACRRAGDARAPEIQPQIAGPAVAGPALETPLAPEAPTATAPQPQTPAIPIPEAPGLPAADCGGAVSTVQALLCAGEVQPRAAGPARAASGGGSAGPQDEAGRRILSGSVAAGAAGTDAALGHARALASGEDGDWRALGGPEPGGVPRLPGGAGQNGAWAVVGVTLLWLPVWLLARRLARDRLLDNPTRRAVLERVVAAPGATAGRVARELHVNRRTAGHHLRVLHEYGLVEARLHGARLRYFENGGRFTDAEKRLHVTIATDRGRRVAGALAIHPGLSLNALARAAGVPKSTAKLYRDRIAQAAARFPGVQEDQVA